MLEQLGYAAEHPGVITVIGDLRRLEALPADIDEAAGTDDILSSASTSTFALSDAGVDNPGAVLLSAVLHTYQG